jgi:hypothetical protein
MAINSRHESRGKTAARVGFSVDLPGIGLARSTIVKRKSPVSEPDLETDATHSMLGSASHATLVARRRTLAGFAREAGRSEGIAIALLAPGTTLMVQTRNSLYRLVVLNDRHAVLAQGGTLLPEATAAHLQGASAGGCLVRAGWIGVGLRLELRVGSDRIVTSSVQSIAIENAPPLYSRFQHDL